MSRAAFMVTGSRELDPTTNLSLVLQACRLMTGPHRNNPVLIHGAARGADTMAAAAAQAMGWRTLAVPARWDVHTAACPQHHAGRSTCAMAGHRRNAEMIALRPDLVIALPAHPRNAPVVKAQSSSRGTWSAVDKAMAAHIPTLVLWKDRLWPADPIAAELIHTSIARIQEQPGPNGEAPVGRLALPF